MKNKAFTMAEAMIVLTLVSVLAGLSVTAVSNARPDESIIKFRKAYSTTTRIVNELINDEELYPHAKEPLAATSSILGNSGSIKGISDLTITNAMGIKYPCLNDSPINPTAGKFVNLFVYKANPVNKSGNGQNSRNMTTPDGLSWTVYQTPSEGMLFTGGNDGVMAYVEISTTASACIYNSATCPIPTKFKLNIYYDGKIVPVFGISNATDPMACSYIRYSKINKASKIPTDPSINSCFPSS